MPSFGFYNSFGAPKPVFETKTGSGWSPFGTTTTPAFSTTSCPAFATSNPAFDFTTFFGAPVFNTASTPAFGTNCTTTLATTGTPAFGTTSTPTIGTPITITPGVGTSTAPTGGTNAIAITSSVGTASTPTVGNSITIAPSVGATVTIAPALGTSITITQAAGTTITITSNPTYGATSTPVIGGASTPSFCFPTPTAPTSTPGIGGASTPSFFFPTSTAPTSTPGGFTNSFGFPTSTTSTFAQSTCTSCSSQVGASSPFGPRRPPFGAQSTPIVGNNASRQSAFRGHHGQGSRVVPYTASAEIDSNGAGRMKSISAMPIHEHKCHEELRWEDYQLGDKGGAVPPGGSGFSCQFTTQSFLQKEKPTSFGPYGSPFAHTSSSTSNISSSSPFGQPSSSPFGQPSSNPYGRTSSSPFAPPSSSQFVQPSSSPFAQSLGSSISGNSNLFTPSSIGQTSPPHPSWCMHSQVSQPVQTSIPLFNRNQTNTGSLSIY
ncbi:nuclear pore complex protein NUP98A isoform X2 [Rosa chinensis]|uniref:nuclear pore complex protein NUP98A isoform X2 n=1 Tax=Rosa chinensis TaxID=74649 RepID=UPI000D08BDB0|nr:nuclear pore complex protein NUP98A isoform X2 [Rosa chinensis]